MLSGVAVAAAALPASSAARAVGITGRDAGRVALRAAALTGVDSNRTADATPVVSGRGGWDITVSWTHRRTITRPDMLAEVSPDGTVTHVPSILTTWEYGQCDTGYRVFRAAGRVVARRVTRRSCFY